MLVRSMDQLEADGRVIPISHGKATAVRLITKGDGLNFSLSEARAQPPDSPIFGTRIIGRQILSVPAMRP